MNNTIKVVFDFQWGISMLLKNWEIIMPINAIPRIGESITADELTLHDGQPYGDFLCCRIADVDWSFNNGVLNIVTLRLSNETAD